MKRILFVLAVTLILTVCFVGEAFALNRPWTEVNNDSPNGDEHPWGGDGYVDPPPTTIKTGSPGSYITGIYVIDIIFKYFIFEDVTQMTTINVEKQSRQVYPYERLKYSSVKSEGTNK